MTTTIETITARISAIHDERDTVLRQMRTAQRTRNLTAWDKTLDDCDRLTLEIGDLAKQLRTLTDNAR